MYNQRLGLLPRPLASCAAHLTLAVFASTLLPAAVHAQDAVPTATAQAEPAETRAESRPDDASSRKLLGEYEDLVEQRGEVGIGGPIALLAVGGFVALVGLTVTFMGMAVANDPAAGDSGSSVLTTGLVMLGIGGAGAVGGGLWLGSRLDERRSYDPAIEEKERELRLRGVDVGAASPSDVRGFYLRTTF